MIESNNEKGHKLLQLSIKEENNQNNNEHSIINDEVEKLNKIKNIRELFKIKENKNLIFNTKKNIIKQNLFKIKKNMFNINKRNSKNKIDDNFFINYTYDIKERNEIINKKKYEAFINEKFNKIHKENIINYNNTIKVNKILSKSINKSNEKFLKLKENNLNNKSLLLNIYEQLKYFNNHKNQKSKNILYKKTLNYNNNNNNNNKFYNTYNNIEYINKQNYLPKIKLFNFINYNSHLDNSDSFRKFPINIVNFNLNSLKTDRYTIKKIKLKNEGTNTVI